MQVRVNVTRNSFITYIGFIMMNLYYGFVETIFDTKMNFLVLIMSLLLLSLGVLIENKFQIKNLITIIILLGVFIYNYIVSNDSRMIVVLITIFATKSLKVENLLKVTFYEKIITTLMVVVISLFSFGNYYTERAVLGFSHGNLLMLTVTEIILLYICCYWGKIGKKVLLMILLLILASFGVTKSRSGFIISLFIWAMVLGYKYFQVEKTLEFGAKYLSFLLMFLSVFLSLSLTENLLGFFNYIPGFSEKFNLLVKFLDDILSSRLTLSNLVISNTHISWFYSIRDDQALSIYKYLVVDSGYIQLLLVFGFLGSIIFLLLNRIMVNDLIKRKQYFYLIAVIAMAIYGFTENSLCSLKYNFTLLFFVQLYQPNINDNFTNLLFAKTQKNKRILVRRR